MPRVKTPTECRRNRLHNLRSFCYAAQLGSISRAAERASLSQPSVSLQIQALEKELRTTLFQRRGPKIMLTPDGQALYEMAWPLVDALDSLPGTFQTSREGLETGRLSIAAGEATILYILPPYIQRFAKAHPGIELKLHNVAGLDGLKLLRGDAADLAVGSLLEVPDDLVFEPLFCYDPLLITAIDHPLTRQARVSLRDVAQYPLILPPRHLTTARMVDALFQKHQLNYRVSLEAGGWEVIKRYVEMGLGISLVTSVCLTGRETLAALPFGRYLPRRNYGVVLRKGRILSGPAARFIETLKSNRHLASRTSETAETSGEGGS